jgi:hypothetical protein
MREVRKSVNHLYSKPYFCFFTLSRKPGTPQPTLIRLFFKLINSAGILLIKLFLLVRNASNRKE